MIFTDGEWMEALRVARGERDRLRSGILELMADMDVAAQHWIDQGEITLYYLCLKVKTDLEKILKKMKEESNDT